MIYPTAHKNIAPLCLLIVFLLSPSSHAQQRSIELEIHTEVRARVGTQQKWAQMLQDVGADRVVVKAGGAVDPRVEETQLSRSTLITVTGSISRDRLYLPGSTFSLSDKAGISALIQKLRDDGAKVALADKKAFGLTSEQLVALHGTLSKPLNFDTRDMNAGEAVQKISELIGAEIQFDSVAAKAFREDEAVSEELNGFSAGTALAVVVRPLGLVLQPSRPQGKPLNLMIVDSTTSTENWPIGWPIDASPVRVAPKLFERMDLEIRSFALNDALNAIEKRTGVPFLYDQNSLAREGVELSQTKVTLVQNKVAFLVAVGKLLRQSKPKLIDEIRVDENSKPFLWISVAP